MEYSYNIINFIISLTKINLIVQCHMLYNYSNNIVKHFDHNIIQLFIAMYPLSVAASIHNIATA